MLFPCDEILIFDHSSKDATLDIAREYGARIHPFEPQPSYATLASGDWIFALDTRESFTESLAATLFEWKAETIPENVRAFSVYRRDETAEGWISNPIAQTRLVRADWNRWTGFLPAPDESAGALEGDLLHFVFP